MHPLLLRSRRCFSLFASSCFSLSSRKSYAWAQALRTSIAGENHKTVVTVFLYPRWLLNRLLCFDIVRSQTDSILQFHVKSLKEKAKRLALGRLGPLCEQLKELNTQGYEVILVTSGAVGLGKLNILAELLLFGDLEFYKDWWDAKTLEEYWRMWNMGVAILIAFLVSALFHELVYMLTLV